MSTTETTTGKDFVVPETILSLRKFHHAQFASEETNCFEAVVVVNGKPAFHARNDGKGGCDHLTPLTYDDAGRKAMEEGIAFLKDYGAKLPPYKAGKTLLDWDVEFLVANCVERELYKKDAAKLTAKLKDRYLFVDGNNVTMTKKLPPSYMTPEAMAQHLVRHPERKMINLMPQEQREAIFFRVVRGLPLS